MESYLAKSVFERLSQAHRRCGLGGELWIWPRYPLDFNPIEPEFSFLKRQVCRTAPRDVESCCEVVRKNIEAVPGWDCFDYFRNVGYAVNELEHDAVAEEC